AVHVQGSQGLPAVQLQLPDRAARAPEGTAELHRWEGQIPQYLDQLRPVLRPGAPRSARLLTAAAEPGPGRADPERTDPWQRQHQVQPAPQLRQSDHGPWRG